ncbi:MAG: winged helix-turn-helix transcriptional regulator [Gammaproteobacteria bacterium]|nr:winged helix-turn-helix transcriptional regulator [Gammaproteobacteria bacterium]
MIYAMLSNYEIKADSELVARTMRAVADPARVRLLRLCADRATSVSELAAATSDSEPNVSRHLKALAQVGLLRRVRRGQRVEYQPTGESGFAADLLGLLLSRLAADDAALREARARLHAIEAGARAALRGSAADWVIASRFGRNLRMALGAEFERDLDGARVLLRSQHREVLELVLKNEAALDIDAAADGAGAQETTLRAASKPEKTVLQSWLETENFDAEVQTSAELRASGIFDVIFEAPLADELRDLEQLDSLLQRARAQLADGGVLWLVVPYDLLEGPSAPPLRLRALLAAHDIDCLTLAPVEAEGRHVLAARGRVRSTRKSAAPERARSETNLLLESP